MIKKIALLAVALFAMVCTISASERVYYVNSNSVNVRQKPNVNSKKVGKLLHYDCVSETDMPASDGWLPILYNDDLAYVNSRYLTLIQNKPITKEMLSKRYVLKQDPDSDYFGYLDFDVNGNEIMGSYFIVSKSMRRNGGSGTVDVGNNSGEMISGYPVFDEGEFPVVVDAATGLLVFGPYLWEVEK